MNKAFDDVKLVYILARLRVFLVSMLAFLLPCISNADQYGDFIYSSDGTNVTITGYTGTNSNITIPDSINGRPVVCLGIGSFAGQVQGGFGHNSGASPTSVRLSTNIGNISYGAFESCTNLTNVTMGDSVTNIESRAFSWCTKLSRLTIGNGVKVIGLSAFDHCTSLSNVTFGNSITEMGPVAFEYCTSLTSITIPDSVTNLDGAFSFCTSLTNAILGVGISQFWGETFYDCTNLHSIVFKGNAPSLADGNIISLFYSNAVVYYQAGTTGWGATYGGLPTKMVVPSPTIETSGKSVVLRWAAGTLLETTNVASGPWATNSAVSPFTNTPSATAPMKFYRIQYP